MRVRKRDGRIVDFNPKYISDAIMKAYKSTYNVASNEDIRYFSVKVEEMVDDIVSILLVENKNPEDIVDIEHIQDNVEMILMKYNYKVIAKEYILYRQKRMEYRQAHNDVAKLITDLVSNGSEDDDNRRENANINADTPMGTILKIGSTVSQNYMMEHCMKKKYKEYHQKGIWHENDRDFFWTFNCLLIPLGMLLRRGFGTGHGSIRQPSTIGSASTLTCIIIQSSQNSCLGGQAIPNLDWDLGVFVAKSYIRNVSKYLSIKYNISDKTLKEQFVKPLDEYLLSVEYGRIINEAGMRRIQQQIADLPLIMNKDEFDQLLKYAYKQTDRDTYQSMESLIHNLCTLACFHPKTELEVDRVTTKSHGLKYTIEDLYKEFRPDTYRIASINPITKEREWKFIDNITKIENNTKPIVQLFIKEGDKPVCLTYNHNIYHLEDGDLVRTPAKSTKQVAVYTSRLENVDIFDNYTDNACQSDIVYDIEVRDNHNLLLPNGMLVANSRAGSQVPFSSVNLGLDTSEEGRMVTKNLFLAQEAGLGSGETAIFPISIMRLKKDITDKGSPNYDLFRLACRCSAKRLFPNFLNMDASYNKKYYKEGRPETHVSSMGCRTRVIGNTYDPTREIGVSRGNICMLNLNLPYIALQAKREWESIGSLEKAEYKAQVVNLFMKNLTKYVNEAFDRLTDRFEMLGKREAFHYPFVMGQGLYLDSEKLGPNDPIRPVIAHGTLTVGFIGLAECLIALTGKHHGESETSQKLGISIIKHMANMAKKKSEETKMNYSIMGSPAEGATGRLMKCIQKEFGIILGISDKSFITNSSHIPVYYPISAYEKILIEAPYHELEAAGAIAYVELDSDISQNLQAFEDLVTFISNTEIGYFSINHPVDRDPVCGYVGVIKDQCPRCGRREGEGVPVEKLMSLLAYQPDPIYAIRHSMIDEENETIPNSIDRENPEG